MNNVMIMRNGGKAISEIFTNYHHRLHQFSGVSVCVCVCVIDQKACIRSSLHTITIYINLLLADHESRK